jgi:hypothetical protein
MHDWRAELGVNVHVGSHSDHHWRQTRDAGIGSAAVDLEAAPNRAVARDGLDDALGGGACVVGPHVRVDIVDHGLVRVDVGPYGVARLRLVVRCGRGELLGQFELLRSVVDLPMLERVLSVGGEVDERQLLGLDRRLLVDRVELEDRWCENRGVCGADGDDGERRGRRLTRCDPVAAAAEAYAHRLLVLGGARQGVTADRYIQPVRAVPHLVGAHNEIAEQFVQDRGPERQIAAVGECEDDVGLASTWSGVPSAVCRLLSDGPMAQSYCEANLRLHTVA